MAKYNALDNQKNAAELFWQIELERQDLSAAIDYNHATAPEESKYWEEEDFAKLAVLHELLHRLKTYCGEETIEAARHTIVEVR